MPHALPDVLLRDLVRVPLCADPFKAVLPEGHIPDGLKVATNGDLWVTTVLGGTVDILAADGTTMRVTSIDPVSEALLQVQSDRGAGGCAICSAKV